MLKISFWDWIQGRRLVADIVTTLELEVAAVRGLRETAEVTYEISIGDPFFGALKFEQGVGQERLDAQLQSLRADITSRTISLGPSRRLSYILRDGRVLSCVSIKYNKGNSIREQYGLYYEIRV